MDTAKLTFHWTNDRQAEFKYENFILVVDAPRYSLYFKNTINFEGYKLKVLDSYTGWGQLRMVFLQQYAFCGYITNRNKGIW